MKFDIERMERELREDRAQVARMEAHQKAIDALYLELGERIAEYLSAPWKQLAADIRATPKARELP